MRTFPKASCRDFCRLAAAAGFSLSYPHFSAATQQSALADPKPITADQALHNFSPAMRALLKARSSTRAADRLTPVHSRKRSILKQSSSPAPIHAYPPKFSLTLV
jgi:hypothetical protein